MDYVIVGTAGHVDHGKTVLVKALTGKETDRLKEEKERGISIELGFAPFKLPNGSNVGIVDVPGHERFIRQMLAGVAGIDLVMLVIAADESVMPQTREHLDIIDLLQVRNGIIVVTKKDLVDDEWLQLVMQEIKETVAGTVLADAPLVTVSAATGAGMDELRGLLEEKVANTEPKPTGGRMRLPIDRFFSVTGFGTVVTGTLWSGKINVGEQVEIMPEGLTSRIRNIQVHGENLTGATAGQRVAVNLADVEVEDIRRGQMVAEPGLLKPSHRMDVQLRLLASAAKPLKQRARIRLYLGTAETYARVNLLDREELKPGGSCFCQFLIEEPVVGAKQDRFVIRTYSPMYTIGGGLVVDPSAPKHKRYRQEVIDMLSTKLKGSAEELILQTLSNSGELWSINRIQAELTLSDNDMDIAIAKLVKEEAVTRVDYEDVTYLAGAKGMSELMLSVKQNLVDYHQKYPLRAGIAKEELRSRRFPTWTAKQFNAFLYGAALTGLVKVTANGVAVNDHDAKLNEQQQETVMKLYDRLNSNPFQPPLWPELVQELGLTDSDAAELLAYLVREGNVERVNDQLVFSAVAVQEAKELIANYTKQHGSISLAEVRDILGSSRKYVLPLLEHFDQTKFTKRVQDKRILF